jgi:hypothetical protein
MRGRSWVAVACMASLGLLAAAVPASAGPVLGDPCPNGDVRKAQGVANLPDCMALEQVSPAAKENQPAKLFRGTSEIANFPFSGGVSLDGDRVLFLSLAPLGGTSALLSAFGDRYVATRDPGGKRWLTSPTSPPGDMIYGWGAAEASPHPRDFSADFSSWLQMASTLSEFNQNVGRVLRGNVHGTFQPLSPLFSPVDPFLNLPTKVIRNAVESGASSDLSRLLFVPGDGGQNQTAFLSGDPTPANSAGARKNTYIAGLDALGSPSLQLLARDRDGKVWGGNCGARVGAGNGFGLDPDAAHNRGAISADGSRIYFTTRPGQPDPSPGEKAEGKFPACNAAANKSRIMVREETPTGPRIKQLFQPECDRVSPPCDSFTNEDDTYQSAAVDGSRVYFTTSRQLANDDEDAFGFGCSFGCDLYLYDSTRAAGEGLTAVTAGGPGNSTPIVVATSGDGSRVYFTSTEVLSAEPGPGGSGPTAGQLNLYLFERGASVDRRAFVGTLATGELAPATYPVPVLEPNPPVVGATGGDGRWLVFASKAPLTADDTDGSRADIFRYDAVTGELARISKALGGSDNGAFDVTAGFGLGASGSSDDNSPAYAVQGRWVSEDGRTIAFKTAEGLVSDDINGVLDSYLWRDGGLFRLPGSTDPTGELQDKPVLSVDGRTIAYMSFQQLVPTDGDTAADVYVLRPGGGFLQPAAPVTCVPDGADQCQGSAAAPPAGSDPASRTPIGRGNLSPGPERRPPCPKGKRRAKKGGKVRCVKPKKSKRRHSRRAAADRRAGR